MKIQLHEITVRDLVEKYKDEGHDGARGYDGIHCTPSNLTR